MDEIIIELFYFMLYYMNEHNLTGQHEDADKNVNNNIVKRKLPAQKYNIYTLHFVAMFFVGSVIVSFYIVRFKYKKYFIFHSFSIELSNLRYKKKLYDNLPFPFFIQYFY